MKDKWRGCIGSVPLPFLMETKKNKKMAVHSRANFRKQVDLLEVLRDKQMAANRRKQDDKNLEVLRELITINGNKYCLDCNQRGPTYVNTTIGSFVCSKCSGMLRGITPPHRVKSISMATFTPEEIEFIRTRGNDYCRRLWLGLYEGESVNFADEQSVRDFMSDKYEKKRYYLESQSLVTNGTSAKNKLKSKVPSSLSAAHLISLPAPPVKSAQTNYSSSIKGNAMPGLITQPVNTTHKSLKRFNNVGQPFNNNSNSNNTQVPEFPVDFSNADIYCCNQFQVSNVKNNNITQEISPPSAFEMPTSSTNDRYAALADLDFALRQQNLSIDKPAEEVRIENKNPFQCPTNDIFANKNPFSNGGWNSTSSSVPVNPFAPSTNNGNHVHSNNPFL